MKTLRDLLDLPLPELGKLLHEFLHNANAVLAVNEHNAKIEEHIVEKEAKEVELPHDLSVVIELHKAIVEKYQATGSESLLENIVSYLASERGCEVTDDLTEEVRNALEVSDEKKEILNMHPSERAEFVARKVVESNLNVVEKMYKTNDNTLISELDSKALDLASGIVPESDLKLVLRAVVRENLKSIHVGSQQPNDRDSEKEDA